MKAKVHALSKHQLARMKEDHKEAQNTTQCTKIILN